MPLTAEKKAESYTQFLTDEAASVDAMVKAHTQRRLASQLSPPAASPSVKKAKVAPPSPPAAPGPVCPPHPRVEEDDGPSVFDIFNVF